MIIFAIAILLCLLVFSEQAEREIRQQKITAAFRRLTIQVANMSVGFTAMGRAAIHTAAEMDKLAHHFPNRLVHGWDNSYLRDLRAEFRD